MNKDRLARYAPLLVVVGVIALIMACGAIGYWRKAGQQTTTDPIVILASPTPTVYHMGIIAYFDYNDPQTAVEINPNDIVGRIAHADPDWSLVLMRGGGHVWLSASRESPDLTYRPPTETPAPVSQPAVMSQPPAAQGAPAPVEEPTVAPVEEDPVVPSMQPGQSLQDYAHNYDEQMHTVRRP